MCTVYMANKLHH